MGITTALISTSSFALTSSSGDTAAYRGKVIELEKLANQMGLSGQEAFNKIISQESVVVNFSATWCGPCKRLAPRLKQYALQQSHVVFLKIDVDLYPSIAKQYDVRGVPTMLYFDRGQVQGKTVGDDTVKINTALSRYMSRN